MHAVSARAHAARNTVWRKHFEGENVPIPGQSAKIFFYEVAHALTTQRDLAVPQRIRINKASILFQGSYYVEGITRDTHAQ